MATFALIHGGWLGPWCWDALTPLLLARGHQVIALDLPFDDPAAACADYADLVCDELSGTDSAGLILVGHSLAGCPPRPP